MIEPFLRDPDFVLYRGDALAVLRDLPDASVDCVMTSPPYWGLRDYGTGEWTGGDAGCNHRVPAGRLGGTRSSGLADYENRLTAEHVAKKVEGYGRAGFRDRCETCGAERVDGQLGLEATPEEYVASLVEVFREVRRVLAAHGTLWLNLGDSYASGEVGRHDNGRLEADQPRWRQGMSEQQPRADRRLPRPATLRPKDLVGIPWRVAFALQADGWWLRSEIIWAKPNPMPESVTDRPTKAHEQVFLLSKSPRYFFDQEAVREPHTSTRWGGPTANGTEHWKYRNGGELVGTREREGRNYYPEGGRNVRSVWEIATQPFPGAHFATFPEELVRRCILAGCPPLVCERCGPVGGYYCCDLWAGRKRPGIVLDPFLGSGTVALVARKHGRRAVGVELSEAYCQLAAERLSQLSLLA